MIERKPVCLALPGAATNGHVISGALEFLAERFMFVASGGTSMGGLIALAVAMGMTSRAISEMLTEMLTRDDLLDKGWPFDKSPGIYKGEVFRRLLKDVFGKKRMKDLKIPCRVVAVDLCAELPMIIDSVEQGDVLCADAGYATAAIEGFFDPGIVHRDNPLRKAGDGGLVINCPAGIWDDKVPPTISMRFAHQRTLTLAGLIQQGHMKDNHKKTVKTWEDLIPAIANTAMNTACTTLPSVKPRAGFAEIVLHTNGDGMKFGLSKEECATRRTDGQTSARAANLFHLE